MSASEEINAKLDWCISALKYLLQEHAAGPLPADEDDWLEDEDEDLSQFEHLAVRTPPRPKVKACPHNRQGIDDAGNLVCQRCGFNFTGTGSVQNRVGPNGGIVRDPNPPGWALEHSPGASSKNPGSPLVPHSV